MAARRHVSKEINRMVLGGLQKEYARCCHLEDHHHEDMKRVLNLLIHLLRVDILPHVTAFNHEPQAANAQVHHGDTDLS
jgi:hypothetical protein